MIHEKNLQALMKEIYKFNPEFNWDIFVDKKTPYNLRAGNLLKVPKVSTSRGINSIVNRGSLAWNKLPSYIKESTSFDRFTENLKDLKVFCNRPFSS